MTRQTICMTGQTICVSGLTLSSTSISSMMYSPNLLVISKPGTNTELLKITSECEILYNVNGEMIKVNCSNDLAEAFTHVVFGYSNSTPEEVVIQKYLDKNNLHHAYLIEGEKGGIVGEIKEFLKSLGISTIGNPDFIHITIDNFKIDEAFDLRAMSSNKSFSLGKKIFIICVNNFSHDCAL